MITKTTLLPGLLAAFFLIVSCEDSPKKQQPVAEQTEEIQDQLPEYNPEQPKTVLAHVASAQGGWDDLWNKKDVEFSYDYRYPDGTADVSLERYIFDTEASYAKYSQNDINAMPGTDGTVEQYFDGEKAMAMVNGEKIDDPAATGGSDFLRRANYFWFVMPYKLSDDATKLKYMGQETYNEVAYDKIEVTYDSEATGKPQNDSYILYVNPDTKLIDRFFFSLPAMGMNVPAIAANYEYEEIEGQMVSAHRKYFMPDENGEYGDVPSIVQTLTNVKFDNGFTNENIMK
ncbi:MAG: DUF6503 family protein [Leeuwenhoekiella sp.]